MVVNVGRDSVWWLWTSTPVRTHVSRAVNTDKCEERKKKRILIGANVGVRTRMAACARVEEWRMCVCADTDESIYIKRTY